MDRLSHAVSNSASHPSLNRASTVSLAASVESLVAVSPVAELAWKHGMYARRVLIAAEDRKEYEALRDARVAERKGDIFVC